MNELQVLPILVCFDVKIIVEHHRDDSTYFYRTWEMGHCKGIQEYRSDNEYVERCCVNPGNYTLICRNEIESIGWGGSYIEIKGRRYCDDFSGQMMLQSIDITGRFTE